MSRRDVDAAERYYQSADENSQAIVDPTLREGLTRRLAMNRVCLLAQRGDVDAAEQFSVPMVARFNAEFSQIGRLSPGQNNFWSCLSFAQRENGRYAEAVRTAQTIVERCRANKTAARIACEARPLREQALAELDWGRNTEALATMQERLKAHAKLDGDPNAALVYGRALLANGRAQEAIEPLRMAYGSWLSVGQPSHVFAAEVEFWFGQAWITQTVRSSAAAGWWLRPSARWRSPLYPRTGLSPHNPVRELSRRCPVWSLGCVPSIKSSRCRRLLPPGRGLHDELHHQTFDRPCRRRFNNVGAVQRSRFDRR